VYVEDLVEVFTPPVPDYSVPWTSLYVYQDVLGQAASGTVTIVAVGHLTVLLELLEAVGGKQLVASKVKKLIVMGGTLTERDDDTPNVSEWVRAPPGPGPGCPAHIIRSTARTRPP
jgi:hypothetical protein